MRKVRMTRIIQTLITTLVLVLLIDAIGISMRPATLASTQFQTTSGAATLSVISVVKGKSATINIALMPANKEFRVLMNTIGTQGVDGTKVGTAKTDRNGSFTGTFQIPASLKDKSTLAIRIEATDNSGYFAYNWFRNSDSASVSPTSPSTTSVTTGNLTIDDIEEDSSVNIIGKNLTSNQTYIIWFDWRNRINVVKSIRTGTIKSEKDGTLKASIQIPREAKDRLELAVRLQSLDGTRVYTTGWFLNATSDKNKGSGYPDGYTGGIPYIVFLSTVQDESVTIRVYNLPPRTEFTVFMGKFGSKGVDGTKVGKLKTGSAGSATAEFDIPKKLQGKSQIAIRVQSADSSGYFAYSWFNNKTKP